MGLGLGGALSRFPAGGAVAAGDLADQPGLLGLAEQLGGTQLMELVRVHDGSLLV
jgi:hypothetical protein